MDRRRWGIGVGSALSSEGMRREKEVWSDGVRVKVNPGHEVKRRNRRGRWTRGAVAVCSMLPENEFGG